MRESHPKASENDVKLFLTKQPSYTVHRRIRRIHFPRRHIRIPASKIRCDADLIELGDLAPWNKNYKFILIAIDSFSKYIRVAPIKSKHTDVTARAFAEEIIEKQGLQTKFLYTDAGKEFVGAGFQSVLKANNITHRICSANDFHCPFVERAIRTVKENLFQALTANYTREWLPLLPKIVSTYNNTIHSSIKMRPKEVDTSDSHTLEVYGNLLSRYPNSTKKKKYAYKRGDFVRILKTNASSVGHKGYLPRFTWEIFKISRQATDSLQNSIPAYILEDLKGETIQHAIFYEDELSRVHPSLVSGNFPVREIIEQKGDMVKVVWQGSQRKDAEWINRNRLRKDYK